ncbi:MAG: copper amine oxidase N-terminal domain-containing protein [Armatimonadia bacterium]
MKMIARCLLMAATVSLGAAMAVAAPTIVVDGKVLNTAQPVLNRGGAVMLPMRVVFEALAAEVQWRPKLGKIVAKRPGRVVELWISTPVAQVNGMPVQLRMPPALVAGMTYVPLRFVAEAFGGTVRWDGLGQTAFVYSAE